MPEFVIVGHKVPTDPDFPLSDLPGAGGRIDVLARALTAALLTSHGIRDDVRVHLICQNTLTIEFDGAALRGLHPDERSTAARIRSVLGAREELVGAQPVEVEGGIVLRRGGLTATVDRLSERAKPIVLDPEGEPIDGADLSDTPAFVLSDHQPFTQAECATLTDFQAVRLGPVPVHTAAAVSLTHHYLDTDGWTVL